MLQSGGQAVLPLVQSLAQMLAAGPPAFQPGLAGMPGLAPMPGMLPPAANAGAAVPGLWPAPLMMGAHPCSGFEPAAAASAPAALALHPPTPHAEGAHTVLPQQPWAGHEQQGQQQHAQPGWAGPGMGPAALQLPAYAQGPAGLQAAQHGGASGADEERRVSPGDFSAQHALLYATGEAGYSRQQEQQQQQQPQSQQYG